MFLEVIHGHIRYKKIYNNTSVIKKKKKEKKEKKIKIQVMGFVD